MDIGDELDRLQEIKGEDSSGGSTQTDAASSVERSLPSNGTEQNGGFLSSSEFTERVTEQYDGDVTECIEAAVEDVWPAPSFRAHQQEAIVEILENLYVKDKDVVTLSAPTGAGKSLIIYATSRVISKVARGRSFVTTPINALIDQIEEDELLQHLTTLKGKNNYNCVHPADQGESVDEAICQRDSDFDCEFKEQSHLSGGCPYYGRKMVAKKSDIAVTNLSYLMANSMIPSEVDAKFDPRDLLAVDEVQNVEDFALQFVGFTVSPNYIPVDFDDFAPMPDEDDSMEDTVSWIRNELLRAVTDKYNMLAGLGSKLTKKQNKEMDKLKRTKHRLNNFLQDQAEGKHWTKTHDEEYGNDKIKFEPVFVGRFLGKFLWNQCDKVVLSSATIPKGSFLSDIGLSSRDVATVNVPSTFPKERRPVFTDEMVGKMTSAERDETIPEMAQKIADLADHHEGEPGFVHCHSYKIMERLYENLPPDVQFRTMMQDPDEREESLEGWFDNNKQIFLSVKMDEGISLDGDKCRWQVVAKCSYPFMGDERVSYRLNELNDWGWYSSQAAISLQQAVGRGMRSQEDYSVTYLLDSSFESLINRNENLFEDWFLESIDCRSDLDKYGESKDTFSFQ
jgi:Rad3-related DNA helicase